MSATALVGGAISLVGGGISYFSQQKMIAEQTTISKKQENIRKQQMLLDAQRRKRANIRAGLLQRSLAVSNAANQGATGSSGASAGAGAGAAASGEGQSTVNTASILGSRQFKLNRVYFDTTQAGQAWIGAGQGISAIGGTVLGNAGQINALMGVGPTTPGGVPTAPPMNPRYGSAYQGGWGSTGW